MELAVNMSDQAAKDAAAQQRIVNHMQADHHDSVSVTELLTICYTTDFYPRLSATSNTTMVYPPGPPARVA